jgi:hypothetical protein
MPSVTIDVVSFDPVRDQYALHFRLVENENLPDRVDERRARLKAIQDRVFSAFDAAIDGQLAGKYPETLGQTVRIQVDCPFGKNDEIELVVSRVADYVNTSPEYVTAAKESTYVRAVHVVTGHQLGRFQP